MKFTLEWLNDHIDINLSAEELSEKLTSLGIEVESITDNNKKYENFVLGFVTKREKHPDADKLSVCEVSIGRENPLNIVCGAQNVRSGMKVAVALVGAVIQSTGCVLKKGKIRGLESEGMICSAFELSLDSESDGIMDLSHIDAKEGTDLATAMNMNDIIFDVSITPNRADCFSVRGIARLLSSVGLGTLKLLLIDDFDESESEIVPIDIQTKDCSYFSCRVVKNVDSSEKTPEFIARRLSAVGQKLIFAPVDIANYVCLDIGQPLHMFDLDKIVNDKVIIKNATGSEILKTLDGKETKISKDAIIVSNSEKTLSIAGIIGGEDSAFSEYSKGVLIESAYFDKVSIGLAGQSMRIISDSRTRNERGTDPQGVDFAMMYATSLLKKVYPKAMISCVNKSGKLPENRNSITVYFDKFKNLTGLFKEEWKKSKDILQSSGIDVKTFSDEKAEVITPSFRHDLFIQEDIIEEILIALGYDNIKEHDLIDSGTKINEYTDDLFSDVLMYNGYNEIKTFSFIDEYTANLFVSSDKLVRIKEPLTSEFSVLRPSVIASHLKSLKNNQNKSQRNVKFFEVGKKFTINNSVISEKNTLTITLSEKNHARNWSQKQRDVSVFDIKADIEKMFDALNLKGFRIINQAPSYYHPGRSGTYVIKKDEIVCYFGEIHPCILSGLNIDGPVVCCELFLDGFGYVVENKTKSIPVLSPYQPITRDFSFVVDKNIRVADIIDCIKKAKIDFVQNINVFDVYESDDLGENKKAVAIEVLLQSTKNTLNEEEIKNSSEKIINEVLKKHSGVLRT